MERGRKKIADGGSIFTTRLVNDIIAHAEHSQSPFGPTMILQTNTDNGYKESDAWFYNSVPFRFNHVSKKWFIGAFAFPTSKDLVKFLTPWVEAGTPTWVYQGDLRISTTTNGTDFVEFPHDEVEFNCRNGHDIDLSQWKQKLEILLEKMKLLVV